MWTVTVVSLYTDSLWKQKHIRKQLLAMLMLTLLWDVCQKGMFGLHKHILAVKCCVNFITALFLHFHNYHMETLWLETVKCVSDNTLQRPKHLRKQLLAMLMVTLQSINSASPCCNATLPTCIWTLFMPIDTLCSDTLYVYTDPDSLPSFAEECSFGNWSSDLYH